jgi:cytochrome b subunit of formate dehydrogenase
MENSQILAGAAICTVLIWLGFASFKSHFNAVLFLTSPDPILNFIPYQIRLCRLIGGFFMILLALMLVFAMIYLEEPAQHLADLRDNSEESKTKLVYTAEQFNFATRYALFWISFLMVLLLLVSTSSIDAIFSWRYQKQLRESVAALKTFGLNNKNSADTDNEEKHPPFMGKQFPNEN